MYLLRQIIILATLTFVVIGCGNTLERLKNVGQLPDFEKVDLPANNPEYKPIEWPEDKERNIEEIMPRNHNSLWKQGARSFFRDQHSRNIGDIVKVVIQIDDKVDLDNKTQQTRTDNDTIATPNVFGLESKLPKYFPPAIDPTNLANISGNTNHTGEGKITRKETLKTQVAALVTQILPNGSLVLHGKQEIRVNYELREITIDGIVRPEDISSDNSVKLDQIAEARLSYGGRGRLSEVQQPRIGSQVLEILSPF